MKLLAVDTAMAACSVALHESGHSLALAKAFVAMERGHAEAIAPMVRDVMARAGVEFSVLDRVAVTIGPGTFTGVRIGLAMARGLGLALGIPVIGIDTLSAIAANETGGDMPLLVASDARKDEVYAALFNAGGKLLQGPAVMPIGACLRLMPEGPLRVIGTAAEIIIAASPRDAIKRSKAGDVPDAANFGRCGLDIPAPESPPTPLYLRVPDAKPQEFVQRKTLAITVRAVTAAETSILEALHGECFDSAWTKQDFAALLAMPGASAQLAMDADEPVGFIVSRAVADEAEIITIATRPFAQRRGVAKSLLNHQFTEFSGKGVATCFIEVAASNTTARALYASCGFHEAGSRQNYYHRSDGSREDALVMRKNLTP